MTDLQTITEMFSYMRPAGSATEQAFVDRFLSPLGFERDQHKNLVLILGERPNILFSSHMDTVHMDEGMQKPIYDGRYLRQKGNNCLGADDTAGVWLMTEMIKAQIPGVYVIHHAEENGCIGSRDLATENPEFFKDLDIAIAFDRAYYDDVITHQLGQRMASDAFAWSLADQLGFPFGYKPSDGGVFTDTAEYSHLVGECTNLSVGYFGQHGKDEKQDVPFLLALRDALLQVKWGELAIERQAQPKHTYRGRALRSSIEQLCWEYPETAAGILTACGVTAEMFERELEEVYGTAA